MAELRLPENIVICAISRGEQVIAPRGTTYIEEGDFLFVLSPPDLVRPVKELLASGEPIEVALPMEPADSE